MILNFGEVVEVVLEHARSIMRLAPAKISLISNAPLRRSPGKNRGTNTRLPGMDPAAPGKLRHRLFFGASLPPPRTRRAWRPRLATHLTLSELGRPPSS